MSARRRTSTRPQPRGQGPRQIYTSAASRRGSPRMRRRRWVLLVLAVAATTAGLVAGSSANDEEPASSGVVVVVHDGRQLLRVPAQRWLTADRARRRTGLALIPRRLRRRVGPGVVELRVSRAELSREVTRVARRGGGRLVLPTEAVASRIQIPIVRQRLRNNCETAALQMLLAGRGKRVDQLRLQRELPASAPLDPKGNGTPSMVWGDPDRGFVGRPDGGGPAGGYGVYERPVGGLARRYGARPLGLRAARPAAVYRQLLSGRPVMTWIGLSDGPFRSWRTPAGRRILGNFGEHTVVLTGLEDGRVAVNDPLDGRRKTWTTAQFELMWQRLGRRALILS